MFDPDKKWGINQPGIIANTPEFDFPDREKMEEEYRRIASELEQEKG